MRAINSFCGIIYLELHKIYRACMKCFAKITLKYRITIDKLKKSGIIFIAVSHCGIV